MANKAYKVNIYLGKELYETIEILSQFFGVSVPQMAKILLNTGVEFSKAIDSQAIKAIKEVRQSETDK